MEDIDEFPDSTLVLGTKGFGIILWKKNNIIEINEKLGLTSNMLEDVHVDENGILWAGTLNGLNKISFDKGGEPIVRTFTTFNGLPSNEIYQIKSYEGQVWVCTAGGLVKFQEPVIDTISDAPILQYLKVNDSLIQWNINNTFPYNENNLELRYLTINYRQNGTIPYRYRISKNQKWRYTQNLTVDYPSLPPDDYTFEEQSQNEDGFWSQSTVYQFTICPPWWATWWFRILSVLGLGVLIYFVYKNRTKRILDKAKLKQQLTDLEKSALQAQMNPHFIFNCLNSIQNFILQNEKQKAVEYLAKFARLVRHNLNASVQGMISLEEEINLLNNYLSLEQERFDNRFEYLIKVDPLLNTAFIEFPPMLIQPYVENAVIHGISQKKEKGKIEIHFSKNENELLATVSDNGKGYRNDGTTSKKPRHKSVGMTITQKRLELLGSHTNDIVQIKNLHQSNGEVGGTEVQIKIALI